MLPAEARVLRVMPNTPALVKEGAAAISRGSRATAEDAQLGARLFRAVGTCDEVPEYQMDAITALSGSGPAYVSLMGQIYLLPAAVELILLFSKNPFLVLRDKGVNIRIFSLIPIECDFLFIVCQSVTVAALLKKTSKDLF